jgi:Tol biopolymer transport system component
MSLQSGTTIGAYEILGPLGAGGMGEVYKARDPRLGRDVAVKVLPAALAADAERQRRFELEARAAARLNHPNILQIYDVGQHDGQPFLVTEFLDGETLRERMGDAPMPVRKATELAIAFAYGLAAAHEQGIVHRDLKPENLFITRDGRLKILDFGLAKLTRPDAGEGTGATVPAADTAPGAVWGTVGYMSPEQVRGQTVDHPTDLFAFGAILYEMLSGKRAFKGESPADTMSAILKEDPIDLTIVDNEIPLALERIVRHSIEKAPGERFRSAHDLAFQLENLSGMSGSGPVAAAAGEGAPAARATNAAKYNQLSYHRGMIHSGRFASDGVTVVYSAAWDGEELRTYMKRPESPDAIPLTLPSAMLAAMSRSGDMAIMTGIDTAHNGVWVGNLALAPMFGGAPREVAEKIQFADFDASGNNMVITRDVEGRGRVEYPLGTVLYETAGHVSFARVSPDGTRIAFIDHPMAGDDRGTVAVVDLEKNKKTLTRTWSSAQGLAWTPDGREIWFTAASSGNARELHAVTPEGVYRSVTGFPGMVRLFDISKDGRVLLSRDNVRIGIYGKAPGEPRERDLSWLDWSLLESISPDGKTVLFDEENEGVGPNYLTCLRGTNGSPVVRLGEGGAGALSRDGRWATSRTPEPNSPLLVYPTGAGQKKTIDTGGRDVRKPVVFLPDGKRLFVSGREPSGAPAAWWVDVEQGSWAPVEAVWPGLANSVIISADGSTVIVGTRGGGTLLLPVSGGAAKSGPTLEPGDSIAGSSSDGTSIFVQQKRGLPLKIFKVRLDTGARELFLELTPADTGGVTQAFHASVTLDGDAYAYGYFRVLSDLYIGEGLL